MTPRQPRGRRCVSEPTSSPSSSASGAGKVTLACSLHFLTLVDIAPASARAAPSPRGACSPLPAARAAPRSAGRGGRRRARRGPRPGSWRREARPRRRRRPPSNRGSRGGGCGYEGAAGGRAGRGGCERRSRPAAAALPPPSSAPAPTASLARTVALLRVMEREGGGGGREGGVSSFSDRESREGSDRPAGRGRGSERLSSPPCHLSLFQRLHGPLLGRDASFLRREEGLRERSACSHVYPVRLHSITSSGPSL